MSERIAGGIYGLVDVDVSMWTEDNWRASEKNIETDLLSSQATIEAKRSRYMVVYGGIVQCR